MKIIKHIGLTLVQLVKQVGNLPKSWSDSRKQRLVSDIRIKEENERIDRLRHPYKYLGK